MLFLVCSIHSSDYVLNADPVNDRTGIPLRLTYGYGNIAMNLTVT